MVQNLKRQPYPDSHPDLPLDPDALQPGVSTWPPHLAPGLQAAVFTGGCLGTMARYAVSNVIPPHADGWPYATYAVNLAGAFILGLLLQLLFHSGEDRGRRRFIRLGIGTGFIGAFTTYSSLAVETDLLVTDHHAGTALAYAASSIIGGILVCAMGIQLATRRHLSRIRNTP
jgi:fluoride exporter